MLAERTKVIEAPVKQVTIGSVSLAIGLILFWVMEAFLGIVVPVAPAIAFQTVLLFIFQNFWPKKLGGSMVKPDKNG